MSSVAFLIGAIAFRLKQSKKDAGGFAIRNLGALKTTWI